MTSTAFFLIQIGGGGQLTVLAAQGIQQGHDIARAVMVDIAGPQNFARELLQVIIFFVSGVVRANYAEPAVARTDLVELGRNGLERLRPRNFFELVIHPHERGEQAFRMIVEIERVAALDAQEFTVDPERSRLFPRMISSLRTPRVVLQPFEQCVQMVPTCCISQGRVW